MLGHDGFEKIHIFRNSQSREMRRELRRARECDDRPFGKGSPLAGYHVIYQPEKPSTSSAYRKHSTVGSPNTETMTSDGIAR
jgi:hypothetical protein